MANAKSKTISRFAAKSPPADRHARLTRIAFWLLAIIVIARVTMYETLRESFEPPSPGIAAAASDEPSPCSPGPATSLFLDLLCCLPAFLVLSRRILDPTYTLRCNWSHVVMAALALWTAITIAVAGDKFAALIGSANFIAALVVVWSFSQLVRSWGRLRLIAGISFGILLIYIASGLEFRLAELPELRKHWFENKDQLLQQQGFEPGTFAAQQFERKVLAGDVGRFTHSPNSYAAAIVLIGLIAAGVAIQRLANRDRVAWLVPFLIVLPFYCFILFYTRSRAAIALGILGLAVLAVTGILRHLLQRMVRALYWAGVAAFFAIVLAVVAYGLKHDGLGDKSLTFRWYYWTGAAKVLIHHPIAGVGSNNFGQHYLAVRGPGAVEEVQDPHNFIVKAFVETGFVGGILLLAWMLVLWWELTRLEAVPPIVPDYAQPTIKPEKQRNLLRLSLISATAMLLGAILSIDFDQGSAWIALQWLRYLAGAVLLLVGIASVAARSLLDEQLDDRPCPWVLRAMLIALGMFLLHNLIDFPLSETAILFIFAMLLGSALNGQWAMGNGQSPSSHLPTLPFSYRLPIATALIAAVILWLTLFATIFLPTAFAESAAADGDAALRRQQPVQAAAFYQRAFSIQPLNADYAYRAAWASIQANAPSTETRRAIAAAIQADPNSIKPLLLRAGFELRQHDPDRRAIESAYTAATRLDPRNVRLHLEYATSLAALGDLQAARKSFGQAVRLADDLPPDEPKRASLQRDIEKARQQLVVPSTQPVLTPSPAGL